MTFRTSLPRVALACLLPMAACIPYTVGQTAQTLEPGATTYSQSTFVMPHGVELRADSGRYIPRVGSDVEWRHGLDDHTDVGVRMPSLSGIIFNVKKRRTAEDAKVWHGYTLGGGFVNGGEHLYGEFIYHVSASELAPRQLVPYGAFRVSQVVPISRDAVSDTPTIGFTFGAKIGDSEFSFVPEVGVFYDKSALGINSRRIIWVPSLSIVRQQARRARGELQRAGSTGNHDARTARAP